MQNLKNNIILIALLYFFVSACQSASVFNLKTFPATANNPNDLHIISVNSDRVRQKCIFLNAEAENNWRHQYVMYILSDKDGILKIMQATHMDKDSCNSQMHAIERILKSEPQVKMCVRDELRKADRSSDSKSELISFSPFGSHKVTYESMTFDTICNSKKCFGNNDMWVNTCPGFQKHSLR